MPKPVNKKRQGMKVVDDFQNKFVSLLFCVYTKLPKN